MPGCPDLVFASRRKVIFVHGCFWHQHSGCDDGRAPRTRIDYWIPKLSRNVARDEAAMRQLVKMGWQVLVIWQCEIGGGLSIESTKERVRQFLQG